MPSNELRHYGVPGMRWGKRKGSTLTGKDARRESAQMRIAASGGSKKKAAASEAGRTFVKALALGAAGQIVANLSGSPAVAKGAVAAVNIIATADQVRAANRVYNIAKA